MKFIHCADLHLDSKMQTNLTPSKAKIRNLEILNTFERMVNYALQNNVTGIIIAGDMFDTDKVLSQTKQRIWNTIIKNPMLDFIFLSGNHDESNFIAENQNRPANLKVFGNQWQTYSYGNLRITGCIIDERQPNPQIYNTLNLSPDNLNIVVLHGDITNRSVDLDKLKNHNIDYLALGHIHYYVQGKLDSRGSYCYSGCLEGRGFDECGIKGFVMLDINEVNYTLKTQFIPFATRQVFDVKFDITGYNDWFTIEEKILLMVRDINANNLLKITLTGRYPLTLDKQILMLERKLNQFFALKIKDESKLEIGNGDLQKDISLRGEFMRAVMASTLSETEKEQTILWGLKALAGETLR